MPNDINEQERATITESPIPNKTGVYRCVKVDDSLVLRPVRVFGAGNIRQFLGQGASQANAEQIMYRLKDQRFITNFRLDLETGGRYLSEFDGYENWFPGALTYGFLGDFDADIYSRPIASEEYKTGQVVPHWGQGNEKADSTVWILETLDGIDMNASLRRRLQPMWHIRTNAGVDGYINANNISDIFYRQKDLS